METLQKRALARCHPYVLKNRVKTEMMVVTLATRTRAPASPHSRPVPGTRRPLPPGSLDAPRLCLSGKLVKHRQPQSQRDRAPSDDLPQRWERKQHGERRQCTNQLRRLLRRTSGPRTGVLPRMKVLEREDSAVVWNNGSCTRADQRAARVNTALPKAPRLRQNHPSRGRGTARV
ncbi:hypothetical protein VTI74DRAFT_11026 [Chaetomium olivicolor]